MATTISYQTSPRSRYAHNVYFQDGKVLTAVLVLLLYMLLAVSLDAAGYVNNLTVLVPVTLGAFALGFLMSISRFDGFFALSHSMFAGLAWILFLMSRSVTKVEIAPLLGNGIPQMQAQAYYVLLQWLNWVDAAVSNVVSANNYVFIFEMCFLIWWLTYLGVWSIFRYGYTWRAIIPAGIVLLINAYYAPESILGFLILFFLLSLLLLVRTNLSEQQLRWRAHRVIYNQDIAIDFMRNGFLYSVVVLALALIVPGLGRNPQVRGVLSPVNQQWVETQEQINRLYQGLNRQAGPAVATFGNTLTLGGSRNVSDEVVFRAHTPQGRYWRAVVYDSYNGRSWLSTASDKVAVSSNESINSPGWSMREPITQTIHLEAPVGYSLFSAQDIQRVDVAIDATVRRISATQEASAEAIVEDGPTSITPEFEVTAAHSRRSLDRGDRYTVVSQNPVVTELALRTASTEYPSAVAETYLQLPEDFSELIAQDALEVTADQETVYDKARAIEIFLRSYTYNDAIEAPPEGVDPIEYFLYDIREGYCDYYATAMVLMLRSLGIPSRPASGYAEGFYDEESNQYFVTQRDAHTWVEVFFPDYGWIEFEPTAGETQLNRPQGITDEGNPFDEENSPSSDIDGQPGTDTDDLGVPFDDPNMFGEDFDLGQNTATGPGRFWWLWGVVGPIVLLAGLFFLWRTRIAVPTQYNADAAPILYDRMLNWIGRLGLPHLTSSTPYENAQSLGDAVPDGRSYIDTITNSYVVYAFGKRQSDFEVTQGNDAWRQLQPSLWRAWFSKITRRVRRQNNDAYTLLDE